MSTVDTPALRQCVLAVSVLRDLDVLPSDRGVLLPAPQPLDPPEPHHVPRSHDPPGAQHVVPGVAAQPGPAGTTGAVVEWSAIRAAVGPYDPSGPIARRRVESLLRLRRVANDLGSAAVERFRIASRVVALPPGHAEHPGTEWVRETLPGSALDLGIGVLGLIGEMDRTTPIAPSVLSVLQVDGQHWWLEIREHAERMGSLSAARLTRDGGAGLIRPVGGCDVLALLSSRTLRRHLAESDGTGLRSLAVPTRRRGWFDVSQVDPAFVRAAWSLTEEHERGLPVPLLITTNEVALPFGLAPPG